MTDNFEDELRRALRPMNAPAGFTDRVMNALPERRETARVTPITAATRAVSVRAPNYWQRLRAPAALAASLVVAVLLGQQVAIQHHHDEEVAGRAASQELMQALHVSSQKLDLAYQAVTKPPEAESQENRS